VRGGVGRRPSADQAEAAIDRDVIFVTERWNGEIDRWQAPVPARLGLRVFDRPARVAVLLGKLRWLVLPIVGDTALFDRFLLLDRIALLRRRDDRVLASGTLSASPSPGKRMIDSRSLIRNSVRSSDRACIA